MIFFLVFRLQVVFVNCRFDIDLRESSTGISLWHILLVPEIVVLEVPDPSPNIRYDDMRVD